jgi:hypothetical protein
MAELFESNWSATKDALLELWEKDWFLGLGVGVCVPDRGCEAGGRKEACFALQRG